MDKKFFVYDDKSTIRVRGGQKVLPDPAEKKYAERVSNRRRWSSGLLTDGRVVYFSTRKYRLKEGTAPAGAIPLEQDTYLERV